MEQTRTAQDLDLGNHEVGYAWQAGGTPPADKSPGWWFVRMEEAEWMVLFHSAIRDIDYPIQGFSLTQDGEKAAKTMALKLVEVNSWKEERQ